MDLNTYQSRIAPDVYVTMPTVEAGAIFSLVDCLAPLRLTPVRCGYRLSGEDRDRAFLEKITLEIAAIGYAVHRFDSALQRWRGGTILHPAEGSDRAASGDGTSGGATPDAGGFLPGGAKIGG